MNQLQRATMRLAQASNGNPVTSAAVVILFYLMFSFVEVRIEKAIFGKSFEHPLDAVFSIAFMAYAAYSVYWCALFNSVKSEGAIK